MIIQLPSGLLRRSWYVLAGLIICFIAGYIAYGITSLNTHRGPLDLVVPAIFFLGACFVLLVNSLSARTSLDTKRVALLEHESLTDPLTGTYNRRYLERRLKEEVLRARTLNLPLSVLLIDIDNFKTINDTHGHQVGDRVLSCVGERIGKTVRAADIVARYGGDEILVITPDTGLPSATQLAERLRRVVGESLAFPGGCVAAKSVSCAVSIGVATLDTVDGDMLTLLSDVDNALYRAKRDGRNRVVAGVLSHRSVA